VTQQAQEHHRPQALPDAWDGVSPLDGLLALLDLTAEGVDDGGQDVFSGISQPQPHGRVYGGQVLGQTIMAAAMTVPEDRLIHSMHGYFLRPGDSSQRITFAVERLRDGRSFTARRVHAIQHGKPILSMIASFEAEGAGLDHQDEMPHVPEPETLPTTQELIGHIDHPVARYWSQGRPVDVRHVDPPLYWGEVENHVAQQSVWMKAAAPLPDDQRVHRAVLAYASDYTLLEAALRRHGKPWSTPHMKVASLDHAMWFHRPVKADEWLLYTQNSPSASGARGLGVGRIFTRDGVLVATVAQEGMIRVPQGQ
jgi:acyl-CoA thioesterase-2